MDSVSYKPQFIRHATWVPSTSLTFSPIAAPFAHTLGSRCIYSVNLQILVDPCTGVDTGYVVVNKHGKITGDSGDGQTHDMMPDTRQM